MSPASYLTAPPRGAPTILAAPAGFGLTCESAKSRNHVGDGAGGSAWNAGLDPVLRPPDPLAGGFGLDRVPVPPPSHASLAVQLAVRGRPRARVPLHRCRRLDRRDQVAHPGLGQLRVRAA